MHDEGSSKRSSSDTTSATAQHRQPHQADHPSDFLEQQAAEARAAITATLQSMQETLKDSADLKAWTAQYPWPTVGIAAAVGFLAASSLTPASKSEESRDKLAELLNEALDGRAAKQTAQAEQPSMLTSLLGPVMKTFANALQTALVAAVTSKAQQQQTETSTNGHHSHEPTPPQI